MLTLKRIFGNKGEDAATTHLLKNGYTIIARNYSCTMGEVDIIAAKNNILFFIEVKTRSTDAFGGPVAAVNKAKQKRIAKAAISFIKTKKPAFEAVIFDIIAITAGNVEHIPNAFTPDNFVL